MPHLIIEYSKNLEPDIQLRALMEDLHAALGEAETVDPNRIKSRAIAYDHVMVGTDNQSNKMVHVAVLMLDGRPLALQQSISAKLHTIAKNSVDADISVTVEYREMDAKTYQK